MQNEGAEGIPLLSLMQRKFWAAMATKNVFEAEAGNTSSDLP